MADTSAIDENPTLDQFYSHVTSKEPNVRLECFPLLEAYLSDVHNCTDCEDLNGFIKGLLKWIEGSNYRV